MGKNYLIIARITRLKLTDTEFSAPFVRRYINLDFVENFEKPKMIALILPVGPDKIKFVLGKIKNKYKKKETYYFQTEDFILTDYVKRV